MVDDSYSLDIEFELTQKAFRKMMGEVVPRSPLSRLLNSLLAVAILYLAIWIYSEDGFDWIVILFLLMALYHGIPGLRDRLFWGMFSTICRLPTTCIRIKINESVIVTETLSDDPKWAKEETVSWEKFTNSGLAKETKSWFALASEPRFPLSPHHLAFIPKFAFESEDNLNDFRAFLKEKMGEKFKTVS